MTNETQIPAERKRVKYDAMTTDVVVRNYRLLNPLDWGEDCEAELRRMTALWNRLVEIDNDHRINYRAETADDPTAKALKERYDTLSASMDGLIGKRKAVRARARKRVPTPGLDDEIAALKADRRAIAQELFAATKEARGRAKTRLDILEKERFQAAKRARQESGLYWGNYNAVCDSYIRARNAVLKRGGQLQLRRYIGEGRLVNQIPGGMSLETLFAGGHSQVKVTPQEKPIRLGKSGTPVVSPPSRYHPTAARLLTATVYRKGRRESDNRTVTWPLIMNRPLPNGCMVKGVVITRRKIEAHWRWSVTFTCTRAATQLPAPTGRVTAIDLGWRKINEGLRVATVMRDGDDAVTHVMLTPEIIEGLTHPEKIRGHRDKSLLMLDASTDVARFVADPDYREIVTGSAADPVTAARRFLSCIPWRDAPEPLQAFASLSQAPKVALARLAALAIVWRKLQDFSPGDFARLDAWRRRDKHLWLYEVNGRDQAARRRLDLYRREAAKIVKGASVLILEKFDLAKAAKIEDHRDRPLNDAARHQRVIAAPHLLRDWLVKQAKKRGVPIEWHVGVSTWLCSCCGHRLSPRNPSLLMQQCPHCSSHVFDQDGEACRNMLSARREP